MHQDKSKVKVPIDMNNPLSHLVATSQVWAGQPLVKSDWNSTGILLHFSYGMFKDLDLACLSCATSCVSS